MTLMLKGYSILFIILLFALPLCAQEKEPLNLEEIVITATRTETQASLAPASTSVVTNKEIEERTIFAPDQAINTLPGIFDTRGKGLTDTNASINLRGMPGQQRTLILLDGMPLNSAYTGNVQYGGMNPEDIKRMELIRGPFSSLYGGYAMGGVVNILTKMPEKEEIKLEGTYGTDDYWRTYGSYGNRYKDKLSVFVSYGYRTTRGYPTDFDVQSSQPPSGITGWSPTLSNAHATRYLIGDKGNNSWWDEGITAKAAYDITPTSHLNFAYYRTTYEYDYGSPNTYLVNNAGQPIFSYGTVGQATFVGAPGRMSTDTYKVGYETELGDAKAKAFFGMAKQGDNWYITPGSTSATVLTGGPGTLSSSPSTSYFGDLQATRPLFEKHILTVGGSYRYDWEGTTEWNLGSWRDEYSKTQILDESGGRDTSYALFAQDEIHIAKPLTAYLGVRADWWRVFDGFANTIGAPGFPQHFSSNTSSYFSPKGALVYTPFEGTVFRTSLGQAFRPPTIYDLFRTWRSVSGVTYNSNPYLKPETTTSWDIGGEQQLWKGGTFKGTYFDNDVNDLIYQYNADPITVYKINVGKADISGFELSLEQRLDNWLHLFINYTHNKATLLRDSINPGAVDSQLAQVPREMLNAGGDLTWKSWSGSLIGRYVSKRYGTDTNSDTTSGVYTSYDPYFIADAKVAYQIKSFVSVSLAVNNILDKNYFTYYQAPGRKWFGTLTVKF
ncbi:MAG TPA: TonB-dependent receptor [Syntrophorhabdaceae bacterium]|nr:TonB-dependent receptor [Syntrophorhabdaceae bacterium]